MSRQISERTRKVREIVERIPPEKINDTTPTDLQAELEGAGVAPRNAQDMQSVYAEFTRRRRRLGLVKTNSEKGSRKPRMVLVPQTSNLQKLQEAGQSLSRIIEALKHSDATLTQLLDGIVKLDRPLLGFIASVDADDLLLVKDIIQTFGRESVMVAAYSLGIKEQTEGRQTA